MRLKLLMRRLTVSAPRMAVRSALPWPFRWAVLAIVAGFCAVIALWAFEFGKDIAGLDNGNPAQWQQLQFENAALKAQVETLTEQRDKAQFVANTADTVLMAEKVAHEQLLAASRQLTLENQRLKDDLGFFETLIPASGPNTGTLAIRGLQAEALPSGEIKWQVLVIQGVKNPVEFEGRLELVFSGVSGGKPWSGAPPSGALSIRIKQYGRLEGLYQPPEQTVVKSVTVKAMDGPTVRALQTIKIS
ncbi:MAG: hypothetical protein BWK72_16460 [Rhodoferax ferrireducens]|uniref:Uncharacterized protein n=1 Tax=Rhodoferax ferrireducens TaxID=192843 RepID=A0A1W9KQY7_9BURK|nr:MAG: hypothetical protein BWK72_16460 [Rhodoferax ferrireducens]